MHDSYEIKDFQQDVIEASHKQPVLVDFWASWCQPCKMLSPVLNEVAVENKERFKLAKVDTDKHQQAATKYGVRSIPSVKLFIEGKVEAEFQGALPKNMIVDFINKNIPTEEKKELENIKNRIKYGVDSSLIAQLENIAGKPEQIEARILLSQLVIFDQPEKALLLVKGIMEDSPFFHQANAVKTYSSFVNMKDSDFTEGHICNELIKARNLLLEQKYDAAIETLIDTIIVNKPYMDELARRVCIALFSILGNDHPVSRKYRKRFDRSLY